MFNWFKKIISLNWRLNALVDANITLANELLSMVKIVENLENRVESLSEDMHTLRKIFERRAISVPKELQAFDKIFTKRQKEFKIRYDSTDKLIEFLSARVDKNSEALNALEINKVNLYAERQKILEQKLNKLCEHTGIYDKPLTAQEIDYTISPFTNSDTNIT